ncbi:MAG: hypothetical protein M1837_004513 [Sclerophora amabilis]|nr:MAG: hypothetical protein M1837_004513 [Sclerophora amabilis]
MAFNEPDMRPRWQQTSSFSSLPRTEKLIQPRPNFAGRTSFVQSLDKPLPPIPRRTSRSSNVSPQESLLDAYSLTSRTGPTLPAAIYLQPVVASSSTSRLLPRRPSLCRKANHSSICVREPSRNDGEVDAPSYQGPHCTQEATPRTLKLGKVMMHARDFARESKIFGRWPLKGGVQEISPVSSDFPGLQDQKEVEVSPVNDFFESKNSSRKLAPPPLFFEENSRPQSHFSHNSEDYEDGKQSLKGSVFQHFRRPLSPTRAIAFAGEHSTPKRKRPLFSPLLSPRFLNKRSRPNIKAKHGWGKKSFPWVKQGMTMPTTSQDAVLLPNSERSPSGPDTPHPTNALHMIGSKAVQKVQMRMASLKLAMRKARTEVKRSTADKRRSELRKKITILGEADQNPDGSHNHWM